MCRPWHELVFHSSARTGQDTCCRHCANQHAGALGSSLLSLLHLLGLCGGGAGGKGIGEEGMMYDCHTNDTVDLPHRALMATD